MLETPLVRYDSIKINTNNVALSSEGRVSFNAPYNRIDIKFTPLNCSLSYYEVRVTRDDSLTPYDIGVGNLAYWTSNVQLNKQHSFSIPVTKDAGDHSSLFPDENVKYRISMYAKSAVDGSWDVAYIFFVAGSGTDEQFVPASSSGLEVITTRTEPTHS